MGAKHGFQATGGWKFGNLIAGREADYALVPYAMANLSPMPEGLSDEQVLMCPNIMSTDFSGAESGGVRNGDTAAVFALGTIGLRAVAGARLSGATTIICVDAAPKRLAAAKAMGADHKVDFTAGDVVERIMKLTDGRGVDIAIEALGTQGMFENALRVLRPGGTLCPGGKERMRRLMSVVESGRVDLKPLVTHRFKLDEIEVAYELFGHQRDGVLKVAITP